MIVVAEQAQLFNDEVARAKADGIARAEIHADVRWKSDARAALRWCCERYPEFTADEVWQRLGEAGAATTHEPAALGPIFLWASRQGIIVKTGYVRPTRFARRHRDLTVWRSAGAPG